MISGFFFPSGLCVHMYEMKHVNVYAEILAIPGLYDSEMTIAVLLLLNPNVLM